VQCSRFLGYWSGQDGAFKLLGRATGSPRHGGRGAPRAEVIARVAHSAWLRGQRLDGEECDLPGLGVRTVEAVREMLSTGDPELKAIVTNANNVVVSCTRQDAATPTRELLSTSRTPRARSMAVARRCTSTDRPPRRLVTPPCHGPQISSLPHVGVRIGGGTVTIYDWRLARWSS
jgi:hypothetical protein